MMTMLLKSLFFSLGMLLVTYIFRNSFQTDTFISDSGGLGVFATMFGTLYGIMTAFIVFEVWSQYNKTRQLIQMEAQGLERLYRLTLYLRDKKISGEMKFAIRTYADVVIKNKFAHLGGGTRNMESSKLFRKIVEVIRKISYTDEHAHSVFDHLIEHYGQLSENRSERINQSLTRLPILLKMFFYTATVFILITFVIIPFVNIYYSYFVVFVMSFILAMVSCLIEDLDNPFAGFWNLTPEPFERALTHIKEDY